MEMPETPRGRIPRYHDIPCILSMPCFAMLCPGHGHDALVFNLAWATWQILSTTYGEAKGIVEQQLAEISWNISEWKLESARMNGISTANGTLWNQLEPVGISLISPALWNPHPRPPAEFARVLLLKNRQGPNIIKYPKFWSILLVLL
jgi:hypothetical protein